MGFFDLLGDVPPPLREIPADAPLPCWSCPACEKIAEDKCPDVHIIGRDGKASIGVDAIRFLRSIHAVPVWAHPLQYIEESTVREALPEAVEAGLVGMEVMHSSYDEATVTAAKAMADEFGLLYSGGSDFHGAVKPDVYMGVGNREGTAPNIPDEYYENLRKRAEQL